MKTYTVLYFDPDMSVLDAPLGFTCMANNVDHAEEQCENAYPQAEIVWVSTENSLEKALDEYWEWAM